jgi:type IV pilus assembly protein PilE
MRRSTGFTLIELLITMLIVALIVSVAYPSYTGFVTRARRIEAQIALIGLMQQQERFYSNNNRYTEFSSASPHPDEKLFKWWSGATAATSAYELRARACPGSQISHCVELQAIPGTSVVNASFTDRECETLSLDSTGQRRAQGSHPRCWP